MLNTGTDFMGAQKDGMLATMEIQKNNVPVALRKPKPAELLKSETGWMTEPEMKIIVSLAGSGAKQSTCPPPLCTPTYFGTLHHTCYE